MARLAAAVSVAVLALASGAASQAPSSVDCSPAFTGLIGCLPYVKQGSTMGKPTGDCCSGVSAATKSPDSVACLCSAFADGQYGARIDLARAAGLPAACSEDPNVFSCFTASFKVPGAPASAPTAPGAAPAGPSPGSSRSAAVTRSPVSAFTVMATVLATLLLHCLL